MITILISIQALGTMTPKCKCGLYIEDRITFSLGEKHSFCSQTDHLVICNPGNWSDLMNFEANSDSSNRKYGRIIHKSLPDQGHIIEKTATINKLEDRLLFQKLQEVFNLLQ